MSIAALLLAAGCGKRFDASGTHLKLLEPAPCGPHAGTAIAAAAARSLRAALGDAFAVVRPAASAPQEQLHGLLAKEGCRLLVCPQADEGMGTSLAFGVRARTARRPLTNNCRKYHRPSRPADRRSRFHQGLSSIRRSSAFPPTASRACWIVANGFRAVPGLVSLPPGATEVGACDGRLPR